MFMAYAKLGAGRSVTLLRHRLGCSENHVRRLCSRWDWVERARQWDGHIAERVLEVQEKVAAEETEKWARRRVANAEANWNRAQKLADKAIKMLDSKLYEDSTEDGKPVKKPAKWNMGTAANLIKLAAELEQAALVAAAGETDDDFDPTTANEDEARAYLERAGVKLAGQREAPSPGQQPRYDPSSV